GWKLAHAIHVRLRSSACTRVLRTSRDIDGANQEDADLAEKVPGSAGSQSTVDLILDLAARVLADAGLTPSPVTKQPVVRCNSIPCWLPRTSGRDRIRNRRISEAPPPTAFRGLRGP